MFSDRRRLRQWAVQLLLVWLFGLAMGVAHACALGTSAHHTVGTSAKVVAQGHDDQNGDEKHANCLDFCEKSSIGAPKLKVDVSVALGLAALPVADRASMIVLPPPLVGLRAAASPYLRGSPPLRIALQRLAL
jgi:hypothetical protein